ncbi:Molybdopterin synthase subunit MoaE [Candidatus Methylobacter favarea]|uniref:Molybdopterin synthase catalytic subunit n=1 Tax=Candidatus Methylobacter favarea TaxID=2707345 RepID=A0A8S0Y6E8_9GAMM|nr:molybdenum cofactor biosynthesis protein MoaE [Candidatus Methylobacter favarea]CAA9891203.1 Molybdopterin synthase subunit MoaE [Candidatus Methylobacter favarea]
MAVKICADSFEPWQEVQQYRNSAKKMAGKSGATAIFIGMMRDVNEGDAVKGMMLEHYPGMTEKHLEKIIAQAQQQWQILDALVVHRTGTVLPDEPIVLVAVWAVHRGDAYDANRYIMEALKSTAPFWKKELLKSDAERWLKKNTDGYASS